MYSVASHAACTLLVDWMMGTPTFHPAIVSTQNNSWEPMMLLLLFTQPSNCQATLLAVPLNHKMTDVHLCMQEIRTCNNIGIYKHERYSSCREGFQKCCMKPCHSVVDISHLMDRTTDAKVDSGAC